ncbi:MAG TPA: dTDP-4-dehydrorhamnose reductase [Tepidisphaeraceae bacterium]|jgi:dTDP-4-dehydrorhamnose reductase|nr:dTDP-4-dehydrorhamnose reductase [Tepidisphaeraceae bacterium]
MSLYDSILITGGNGMLAHAFRHLFTTQQIPFTAPARNELDITSPDSLSAIFAKHRPTLVLNCAAYTKVDLAEQEEPLASSINGHALSTLSTLCHQHNTKLVHYSTDFVFDGSATAPYKPTDPPNPISAYGRSKLLGEQSIQSSPLKNHLILRTAWVYGPNGACFPQTMLNAARANKPLRVVSDQIGTPTYTRDLASATLDLIDANATGLLHLTNSGQTNWHAFTQSILQEFNLPNPVDSISSADWQKLRPQSAPRPSYSVLDTSDYTRLTGKSLRPWREALHDYHLALSAE